MELIVSITILVGLIIYVGYTVKKLLNKTTLLFYKLYFLLFTTIHFGVAAGFAFFLDKLTTINDPHDFYNAALNADSWIGLFDIGHGFMSFIIYPFVQLGIQIEVFFLVFSVISYKGFLILFELLKVNEFRNKNAVFILGFFLIPSIHFWTVFLGKDPLIFFLMVIILKKIQKNLSEYQLIVPLIVIFLIRPHVGIILIISLLVLYVLDKNKSFIFKRNLFLISSILLVILIPIFFIYFLGIEKLSYSGLLELYHGFVNYTIDKGSTAINLLETTIFERIFYLLLIPLPFLYPIKNDLILFVAIENIYYLSVFIYLLFFYIKKRKVVINLNNDDRFSLIAGVLLILLFASYLYNVGLGNRMRIMFFPYLFYFFISTISKINTISNE